MTLTINGEKCEASDGLTVSELLAQLQLAPERVAVELNRRLLRGEKYQTVLKEGDALEIVTFVGGG